MADFAYMKRKGVDAQVERIAANLSRMEGRAGVAGMFSFDLLVQSFPCHGRAEFDACVGSRFGQDGKGGPSFKASVWVKLWLASQKEEESSPRAVSSLEGEAPNWPEVVEKLLNDAVAAACEQQESAPAFRALLDAREVGRAVDPLNPSRSAGPKRM